MGAWGEGPLDNDSSADWFGDLMEKTKLPDHVEKALRSDRYPDVRAAAWLLEKIGFTFVYDADELDNHLKLAIERLRSIRSDDDWINGWTDSAVIKRELDKQIEMLELRVG